MKIFEKIKSNKKRSGLIISIAIIVIGVIPLIFLTFWADPEHPYTIEQTTLTSGDGTKIVALVYTPLQVSGNHPGVVVGHGGNGNKNHMQGLGIDLVKRGFTVVTIDFRGHGSSEGYRAESSKLDLDMIAAIEYLEGLGNINKIGLVGHSMGGGTAYRVTESDPDRIDAMVAIGALRSDVHTNVLLAVGRFEQGATEIRALTTLSAITRQDNMETGVLYGNFSEKTACKVIVGNSEHLFEPQDYTIVYETVQWFELAFNGEEATDVVVTVFYFQFSYVITLFGVVALFFVLIVYLSYYIFKKDYVYPEKDILKDTSILKLIIYYLICASLIGFIVFLFLSDFFTSIIPISSSDETFSFIFGNSIGIIIIYYLSTLRNERLSLKDIQVNFKEMCSPNYSRSILFGIIATLLAATFITTISHWSTFTSILTVREIGTVLAFSLIHFPFLLIKEFYFRTIQGHLKTPNKIKEYSQMTVIGIFIDNILFVPVMLLQWGSSGLALSLTVLILFSMIQQVLVTWVYMYSGRNILGSTIFLCIFYSWMTVNFFSFGVN